MSGRDHLNPRQTGYRTSFASAHQQGGLGLRPLDGPPTFSVDEEPDEEYHDNPDEQWELGEGVRSR